MRTLNLSHVNHYSFLHFFYQTVLAKDLLFGARDCSNLENFTLLPKLVTLMSRLIRVLGPSVRISVILVIRMSFNKNGAFVTYYVYFRYSENSRLFPGLGLLIQVFLSNLKVTLFRYANSYFHCRTYLISFSLTYSNGYLRF
jgi:hypothetical protein